MFSQNFHQIAYLHQNHCIGYITLFADCFHLQEQPNSSQFHILYLHLFWLSNNGYRTQYSKYLWRHSCLSLRMHHGWSCTKSSNCSNKIKMSKSTTGYRIKSFMPIESINVEKLSESYQRLPKYVWPSLSQMNSKKFISALLATANTNVFFFTMIFANF